MIAMNLYYMRLTINFNNNNNQYILHETVIH